MSEPFLRLKELRRSFGSYEALRGVSLELPPGRIGLLGPNGSGKSTLLKILLGLLPPTAGEGEVLGIPLRPNSDARQSGEGDRVLRRLMGFMPEAEALVPGLQGVEYVALAGELCGMPRRQAQRRAHEVLTYLQMEDARYRRLEEYSLGMKQRIKLAQALVHDPPVLLLDEPTSGMDPAGRDAMLRLLLEIGRDFGKTLILSTHLLADVETVCDQVVLLIRGEIHGVGSVSELCARRKDRFRILLQPEVNGEKQTGKLKAMLVENSVEILNETARGDLQVRVPKGWLPQDAFRLAHTQGLILRGVVPDDETLEEMFLQRVKV